MDPRSLLGAVTFDGAGHFSYSGSQVTGTGAAASQTGSGSYSVDPAGFVSLDSPLRSGAKVNARLGQVALIGATTESADGTYDLFAAIPAPTGSGPTTLGGSYWATSLELPGGTFANVRTSMFKLTASSTAGQFNSIPVSGHAANLANGAEQTQTVTGATYTLGSDGSGTATFGSASTAQLLSGSRTIYVSADGNLMLGGSTAAGAHDFLLGVKAGSGVTNGAWNADYWGAGLRLDPGHTGFPVALNYAGAVSSRGTGNLTWTKRYKAVGSGSYDFSGHNTYSLTADGSGTSDLSSVALANNGIGFTGAVVGATDPGYELYIGSRMVDLSGPGVFLNPQRVLNAASYAPAGNPIAPGEFIALIGTGLAASPKQALPPYPPSLNNVTVLINGKAAPLEYVSSVQINALVPYSTTGPTATIQIQNNNTNSNTVTVPVAAAAPAIFALDQSGFGAGAVRHADFSVVTSSSPAVAGETILVYATGLGTVTPAVADGAIPSASNVDVSPLFVLIGDVSVKPAYTGTAPGYPGLYQINVVVPTLSVSGVPVPLALNLPTAFHDQVSLAIR